ncbi:secondary thiamine-phosphate synthase enzyme YjbQ [bacterium]|nr:secondary thiamine-phosphate synthase enzyme YjbQ [bacterium]MBU1598979.1 secondary thiamine-phosphate synthase enzyme YjbQ [bacterium]MBU2462114.1 secondary thiamine-phosphate synthase enzyme YjbQ [bacterium]
MKKIGLKTNKRCGFFNITTRVEGLLSQGDSGVLFLFCPHTTAGITINEGADLDVITDINNSLTRLIPKKENYGHIEGNSDAHIKTSIIGSSLSIFVEEGKLILGTWQKVFFCEFDGPRNREVWVKIVKG